MKYLICTMYCGELDFPHHCEALKQQGVEYEHRVFQDMIEIAAHNAVYSAFNEASPGVIRAKIDADVVLNPSVLKSLRVNSHSWIDPYVHDYFTDRNIHAGVAIYGDSVKFKVQTDTLKCDRGVANVGSQDGPLIGRHAHYASELSAFHYGFHRGLKSQLSIYDMLISAHAKHKDRVRLMAIRGFELAQSDRYIDWHLGRSPVTQSHNYGFELKKLFDEFSGETIPEIKRTWR